jgi:tRNA(adenine34) deaminase
MRLALAEAEAASRCGEVPIGAIVVQNGRVTGRGANHTRRHRIVHAHAELVALAEAQRAQDDFRLEDASLYVTVEPCLMCLGAIQQSRIARLVYGAAEPKFGALESRFELASNPCFRGLEIQGGVLGEEAARLLGEFFRRLREQS